MKSHPERLIIIVLEFLIICPGIGYHWMTATALTVQGFTASASQENPSVTRLREYLRCKAVQPDPDYASSIEFIRQQAAEIGLEYNIKNFERPGLFAIWLTWRGTDQTLESILLNSHIDVVPVDETKWTHEPFGAEKDSDGNIYGRGAQDMKSVGIMYLEAVRNLKVRGLNPLRNLHISFVPDEEVGGGKGMQLFLKTAEFESLNVGFALDEGFPSQDDKYQLSWAERASWDVEFVAEGQSGHGSILHNNTAAEKIQRVLNAMLDMRTKEKNRMEVNRLPLGNVTTINLTVMKGGQQPNVVPAQLSLHFNIRVTPLMSLTYVENFLEDVRAAAGPQVSLNYFIKSKIVAQTLLTSDNIWWTTFQTVAEEAGWEIVPAIFPAATDARFIRELGIPAFGFTPILRTPMLAHDHNEFVNENNFLEGIAIYERLLPRFLNLNNLNLI